MLRLIINFAYIYWKRIYIYIYIYIRNANSLYPNKENRHQFANFLHFQFLINWHVTWQKRQQFSLTKTWSIESKVYLKIPSHVLSIWACFQVFSIFQDKLEAIKSLKAFILQPKLYIFFGTVSFSLRPETV